MKANELMIGDWVYDTILKCNTQVEMLSLSGIRGDCNENIWNEKTFEPIPLTAEILEKNGWKWNQYNTSLVLVVGTIHVGWGFYPNCIGVSDWAENGDSQITSLRCEFVHELQHILKDCRIDKEIVL